MTRQIQHQRILTQEEEHYFKEYMLMEKKELALRTLKIRNNTLLALNLMLIPIALLAMMCILQAIKLYQITNG